MFIAIFDEDVTFAVAKNCSGEQTKFSPCCNDRIQSACYNTTYFCVDGSSKYRGELQRAEKRFSFHIQNINVCKAVTIIARYSFGIL